MAGPNELWRRSYHMSRYLIPVLLSIMALTLPAFAVLESQKCGPYLVSFDLTTNEEMKISRLNPTYYADHVIYYLIRIPRCSAAGIKGMRIQLMFVSAAAVSLELNQPKWRGVRSNRDLHILSTIIFAN
jgi:hypothetical protein